MVKNKKFIEDNLEKYGLLGTNITRNPSRGFYSGPTTPLNWTYNNWFKWGYHGEQFNWRDSSSCIFWCDFDVGDLLFVDKLKCNYPLNLYDCVDQNLLEISEMYSHFAIQITSNIGQRLYERALHLNLDVVPVTYNAEYIDSKQYLEFCDTVRCSDINTIFTSSAFYNTDLPIIFDASTLFLVNQNVCEWDGNKVGPNYWCLDLSENLIKLNQWSMVLGRECIPNFWLWHPRFLYYLITSNWLDIQYESMNHRHITMPIAFCRSPNEYEHRVVGELDYDKNNESYLVPINKLLSILGIEDKEITQSIEQIYGSTS